MEVNNNASFNGVSYTDRQPVDGNYQDFLKLLLTQLEHQDPTDPADTTQLTQQIATLSQVEQQLATNEKFDQLIGLYSATQYNSLVSYIGKKIEAAGDVGALQDGKALFAYYLQSDAEKVNITIKDENGVAVYTGLGSVNAGRNEFTWDGVGDNGTPLAEGVYRIEVAALDAGGKAITSQPFTTGVVTSIDSANGQVFLSIGDLSIPLAAITSIRLAETI